MTIKQQGGVFGRNPSFNDVEAENLDVQGDAQLVDLNTTGDVLIQIPSSSNPAVVRRVVSGNNWDTSFGGNTLYFTRNGANYVSAAGGSSSFLAFVTGSVGDPTSPVQAFLHDDGRFEMLNNNIVMASGNGIDFSATSGTGTSELFDDYEEGEFGASLTPATSGTITLNGSYNNLAYTKIGRVVTVTGMLIVSSVASPSGSSFTIDGLPFVIADLGEAAGRFGSAIAFYDGATTTAEPIRGFEDGTTVSVMKSASTVGANDQLYIQFTYMTS